MTDPQTPATEQPARPVTHCPVCLDTAYQAGREDGRADALREAADRVRALPQCACGHNNSVVLAILDPQP